MKEWKGFKKGVNLGGWLSQCVHTKEHYDSFISESDFEIIASWGLDHVRIPFDYVLVETKEGDKLESGYQYIDQALLWAEKYGLNVILDLHKTAGYDFSVFDDPKLLETFFFDGELQERFYRLWDTISCRYADKSDHVAFELLNEVVSNKVIENWNQIIRKAIAVIRSHAPVIPILVGGVCYNSVSSVQFLDAPYDSNIIYNFHCYEPFIFTHQAASWLPSMPADMRVRYPEPLPFYKEKTVAFNKDFAEPLYSVGDTDTGCAFFEAFFESAIHKAMTNDTSLYCGEYGVIEKADPESTARFYQDIHEVFEKHRIGRAAWTYKKMDFGLTDDRLSEVFDRIKSNF
jgi:aryl-phospho-beta-D-glucosidase BglC (GH1 family)